MNTHHVINGFVKRAKAYGLNNDEVDLLVKQAFPQMPGSLEELKALLSQHVMNPLKQAPKTFENYRNMRTDQQFARNFADDQTTELNRLRQDNPDALAMSPEAMRLGHARKQSEMAADASKHNMYQGMKGLGIGAAGLGAAGLGAYGAGKAMFGGNPPPQSPQFQQ